MITQEVSIKYLSEVSNLPIYKTSGSAGADVFSMCDTIISPGKIEMISTGLKLEIPVGYEIQIRSRSGLASKGIFVINSPGTIDSDYRDEIKVLLYNASDIDFQVEKGMRIAQMILSQYYIMKFEPSSKLNETTRTGGFGSTGIY